MGRVMTDDEEMFFLKHYKNGRKVMQMIMALYLVFGVFFDISILINMHEKLLDNSLISCIERIVGAVFILVVFTIVPIYLIRVAGKNEIEQIMHGKVKVIDGVLKKYKPVNQFINHTYYCVGKVEVDNQVFDVKFTCELDDDDIGKNFSVMVFDKRKKGKKYVSAKLYESL